VLAKCPTYRENLGILVGPGARLSETADTTLVAPGVAPEFTSKDVLPSRPYRFADTQNRVRAADPSLISPYHTPEPVRLMIEPCLLEVQNVT
jgi:hypothetical protein